MPRLQHGRKARRNRHCGGYRANQQPPRGPVGRAGERLGQHLVLVQHAPGGLQYLLPLGREADEGAPSPHDDDRELFLQRPQGVRKRGLRDVASLRRPGKVAVLIERHQIPQGRKQVHAGYTVISCFC